MSRLSVLSAIEASIRKAQIDWQTKKLSAAERIELEKEIKDLNVEWNELKNKTERSPAISVVMSEYNAQKILPVAEKSILD